MRRLLAAYVLALMLASSIVPGGAFAKDMRIDPRKVGLSAKDLGPKLHVTDSLYTHSSSVLQVESDYAGALSNGHAVVINVNIWSFATARQAEDRCECGLALTGTAYYGNPPVVVGEGSALNGSDSSVQLQYVERTVAIMWIVQVATPADDASMTASRTLIEHLARALDTHILAAVGAKPPVLDLQPRLGDTLAIWYQDWGQGLGDSSVGSDWKACPNNQFTGHIVAAAYAHQVALIVGILCDYAHPQPLPSRLKEAMQFFPRDTKSMGTLKAPGGDILREYYSAGLGKTADAKHYSVDCNSIPVKPGLFTYQADDGQGDWKLMFGTCA